MFYEFCLLSLFWLFHSLKSLVFSTCESLVKRVSLFWEQTTLENTKIALCKKNHLSKQPWTRFSLDSGIIVPMWNTDKSPIT